MTLEDQLLLNARAGKLGHFYLLQGRGADHAFQIEWVKHFIRRYWTEIEHRTLPTHLIDDADLLWMAPVNEEGDKRDYHVDDLKPLAQFLAFRALKSQRRFIVMEDVHGLSQAVANRLLKTLEEPEGVVTFFWLNPTGAKLLSTLESRAMSFPLTQKHAVEQGQPLWAELQQQFQSGLSWVQFQEQARGTWTVEQLFIELLQYEQLHDGPAALKQELLELLWKWQKADRLNQPPGVSLYGLYHFMSQRWGSER